MEERGLVWYRADEAPLLISGPFDVIAETRDHDTGLWGVLVKFRDRDGTNTEIVCGRESFAGEGTDLRSRLAAAGLYLNPVRAAREALLAYLSDQVVAARARVVRRPGWHAISERRIFVQPDRIIGEVDGRLIYAPGTRDVSVFTSSGTLDAWREQVAARCVGNTRLVFAVCIAFAAPLLDLVGEGGGGFNLKGPSRTGKTTALRVAASVWGGSQRGGAYGFVRSWKSSANGIGAVAVQHNDTLLALDELSLLDPRDSGVIYELANGVGKLRADRGGGLKSPASWRVLFISSGEIGLEDLNALAGKHSRAGEEIRLVDVPADAGAGYGLFEHIGTEHDASAFQQSVSAASDCAFGTAAPAFLASLVARVDASPVEFPARLRARIDELAREWVKRFDAPSGQVLSVARRFALAAIGGELAREFGVVSWEAALPADAARVCFEAWLESRGGVGKREDQQAVEKLRSFISRHGSSRFQDWTDIVAADGDQTDLGARPPTERHAIVNRAGWRRWTKESGGLFAWRYFVLPDAMRELLDGLDFRPAVKSLVEAGHIVPDANGRSARAISPPGNPKVRAYEVPAAILGVTSAGDEIGYRSDG